MSFVDWTGPGSAELHFPLPQPLASGQIGSVITDAGTVRLFFDPTLVPIPTGTTLNADARYSTTPVGDINGDGKEELALSSPNIFLSSVQGIADIGITFIVLGGQSGDIQIHSQAHAVIQGSALGEVVSALGDINQDGHDDFAISRSLESNGSLDGGLLIYFGQQTYRTDPNVMAMLGSNDASLTFARSTAGQLAGAAAVRGPLTAAAGDLNGDGRVDLVVGAPGEDVVSLLSDAVLQSNNRGQTSIYFDVMSHGERLIDDAADRILRGTSATARAGSITPGNLRGLNGDSIDDLVIGASMADGLIGGLRADTGRIYFVPGVRQRVELPSDDNIQVIENGDGLVVDRQSGQPLSFPNLELDGEETWVRFTTAGDGAAVGNAVDHVRITPGSTNRPLRASVTDLASVNGAGEVLREGVLRVGGSNNSSAVFEINLRSLVDQWQTSGSVPKVTVTPTLINSATFFAPASKDQFTSVGDRIFFTADDPTDGNGLYVSDGTTAGTRRIDMPAGSHPQNMTTVGDHLFFTAFENAVTATTELWKSDGTDAGTEMLVTLDISAAGFVASDERIYYLTANSAGQYRDLFYTSLNGETNIFIARDSEVVEFFPESLRVTESDFENDPVVYLTGQHLDWSDPVLFASPGNNSNDPNGMFIVGESSQGNILRRVEEPFAFDGLLAFSSFWNNDNGDLTVTNGVVEGDGNQTGIRYFLRGVDGNTLEPKNSHGFLVEKDAYTMQPSDFFLGSSPNPQEYNDWATQGVDLNRDVVYFFGESPDGEGNSVYRMYVDYVNGNMVRNDNLPDREQMRFRLRVIEIASQIGDNPRELVMRGDELFFAVDDPSWGSEVVKVNKDFITVPGSGQTPRLVSDISRNIADSDPRELTVVGDDVFFTATNGIDRALYSASPDDGSLSRFSRVPVSPDASDRLAVLSNRLSFVGAGSLWTPDGSDTVAAGLMLSMAVRELTSLWRRILRFLISIRLPVKRSGRWTKSISATRRLGFPTTRLCWKTPASIH